MVVLTLTLVTHEVINMFFNMAVSLILGALDSAIKNPAKKAAYKDKLLQIAGQITQLYGTAAVLSAADKL